MYIARHMNCGIRSTWEGLNRERVCGLLSAPNEQTIDLIAREESTNRSYTYCTM